MLIRPLLCLFLDFLVLYLGAILSNAELYFFDLHLLLYLLFLWLLHRSLGLRYLWYYLLLQQFHLCDHLISLCIILFFLFVLRQVHRNHLLSSHHHNLFRLHFFLLSLKVTTGETILEGVVAPSQARHRDQLLDPADFLMEAADFLMEAADTLSALISDLAYCCLKVVT